MVLDVISHLRSTDHALSTYSVDRVVKLTRQLGIFYVLHYSRLSRSRPSQLTRGYVVKVPKWKHHHRKVGNTSKKTQGGPVALQRQLSEDGRVADGLDALGR